MDKDLKNVLLVTVPEFVAVAKLHAGSIESFKDSGLPVEHFDGVIADPATDVVTAGATMAKKLGAIVDPGVTRYTYPAAVSMIRI